MRAILNQEILRQVDTLQQAGDWDAALNAIRLYVEEGLEQGRFTRKQVESDLELALQVADANLKIQEYESDWQAIWWLERVEEQASDCDTWQYAYSVACLRTGQLQQAWQAAQQSVRLLQHDPQVWLHFAKLAAHFGSTEEALQAVEQGLGIEPDHAGLLQVRQQILQGKNLEEMQLLQGEELQQQVWGECPTNRPSVLCVLVNQEKLQQIKTAMQVLDWAFEAPHCFFTVLHQGKELDGRFDMNEAGVSKFAPHWLEQLLLKLSDLDQQAKQAVCQTHKDSRLELEHLVIERTGCARLGYAVGRSREERLLAYVRFDCNFSMQQGLSYEDYSDPPAEETQATSIMERYLQEEHEQVSGHIVRVFGKADQVLQDPVGEDIQVDLQIIAPTQQKNYYTVVTLGMGAHCMNVPEELKVYSIERAELVMYLPPDWQIDQDKPQWQWPFQWMRQLARRPIRQKSWLGWGHTAAHGRPFAVNTDFTASILLRPSAIEEQDAVCVLQNKSEVNFYQVVPLYNEELVYAMEHGAEQLLEKMQQQELLALPYVQVQRLNCCGNHQPLSLQQIALLEQIDQWNRQERYEAIVQAVEQLEESQRCPRLIGQQARALNNLNQYERAICLLQSIAEAGRCDPLWHFRLGYACYYSGQEQKALEEFLRTDELMPGDPDTRRFIHWCKSAIALPVHLRPFVERVEAYWQAFSQQEQTLRSDMGQGLWEQAKEQHRTLLSLAFASVEFELKSENGCHQLILLGQSEASRLLQYAYWQRKAPKELWHNWRFVVGQPAAQTHLLTIQGACLDVSEIQTWITKQENERFGIELYGESLTELQTRNPEKALQIIATMLEQVLGEIASVCCVAWVDVLEQPRQEQARPLSELRQMLADAAAEGDVEALQDAEFLMENYRGYRNYPPETEEWFLRQDVIVGSSCCQALVHSYYQSDDTRMEQHQRDGVICGFLFYSNDAIPPHTLVELRAQLEEQLQALSGEDATILGGAIGMRYSYIDCMCFDLKSFLNTACGVLNQYELEEIGFHVFRVDCGGVNLKNE